MPKRIAALMPWSVLIALLIIAPMSVSVFAETDPEPITVAADGEAASSGLEAEPALDEAGDGAYLSQAEVKSILEKHDLYSEWEFYAPNSYWRAKIQEAPVDPNSDHYIESWKSVSSNHNVRMGGMDGWFAFQLYFGTESDPIWTVTSSWTGEQFIFRGPANMTYSQGDNEIVCVDTTQDGGNGVLYAFGGIAAIPPWSQANRTGVAPFTTVQWVKSNGLDGTAEYATDWRTNGHRGLPMLLFGPMISDVQAMHVPHALKLVVPRTGKSPYQRRENHVWPYVGNEGDNSDLPEGARVRLKASVQPRIDAMTNPYAQAIAQAFLTYGAVIGDQGGQGATTNMQSGPGTAAAWSAMGIVGTSLYEFTIDDFEVVELGWAPPGV